MSSAKAKPVQFPVIDPPVTSVGWLDANHETPVRKLFELEEDAPPPPRPETIPPPPAAAPAPAPAIARAPAPPPAPPAPPPQAAPLPPQPAPDDPEPQLDDKVLSQLPPPPRLGSLIPGARSAPPPANDVYALNEHAEAFANAAVELAIARASELAMLEGQLLDLAVDIASALIEREVDHNPELHATLARAALNSLGDSERVTLRCSPTAFDTVCAALGGPEANVRGVVVQVVRDPSIPGLGCVVDGDNMRVDATVTERLRAVRRAFEEERRKVAENSE
ncbi:MAG: FliH/SctL family protein [Polyangiales bacterium]